MDCFPSELRRDVKSGLSLASALLLPGDCPDFGAYSAEMISCAVHGCCCLPMAGTDLFVVCADCSRTDGPMTACLCLRCFQAQDHSGHRVILRQEVGICSCGNPHFLRRSAFCPRHRGEDPDPIVPPDIAPKFESILTVVANFCAESFPLPTAIEGLKWLSGFRRWGDGYRRLVIGALTPVFRDPLIRGIRASPHAAVFASAFFIPMVADRTLALWLAGVIVAIVDDFVTLLDSLGGRGARLESYFGFFHLAPQVFVRWEVARACLIESGAFAPLLRSAAAAARKMARLEPRLLFLHAVKCAVAVLEIVQGAMEAPEMARAIVYDLSEERAAFLTFFSDIQFLISERRIPDGDRAPYDTFCIARAAEFSASCRRCFAQIAYGMKLLAADGPCWAADLRPPRALSEPQRTQLLSFLNEVKESCLAWNAAHPGAGLCALTVDFSIMLELSDLFFYLLCSASEFFGIPIDSLLGALGVTTLLPFVARALTTFAAVTYTSTSAFSRNSAILLRVGRSLIGLSDPCFRYLRWFYQLKLCAAAEPDAGAFVVAVIDAFGCREWLESGGAAAPANVEPWLPACLLCRFFVQLLGDAGRPDRWDLRDILRRASANGLRVAPMAAGDVSVPAASGFDKPLFLEALHEVGNPAAINDERKYRLKSEFENIVSAFWLLHPVPTFLEQLGSRSGNLAGLPPLDPAPPRFVLAEAFLGFTARAAEVAARDGRSDLLRAIIALIQMTSEAARALGAAAPIEAFARACPALAGVPELARPLVQLMELIKCGAPSVAAALDPLIASLRAPARPRRDRSRVLAAMAARARAFEAAMEAELAAVDSGGLLCAACHDPIATEADIWGVVWTGESIRVCAHYLHQRCHSARGCPVCQSLTPLFTPILLAGHTAAQREAAGPTVAHLMRTDFAATVERMAQLLDLDGAVELPQPFAQLMRSVAVAAADRDPRDLAGQPMLLFLSLLPFAREADDFRRLTRAMWQSRPWPEKAAAVLWNCVASDVAVVDLAGLRAAPPDLWLRKAPERFSDLFLPEHGGEEVVRSGQPVCRCLRCGAVVVVVDPGRSGVSLVISHARACNLGLFLGLTGELAASVFRICRTSFTAGRTIRPLYVTPEGDDDMGLKIGIPLVLSRERHRLLMRDILSGLYITDA
jgi:hypothetical protein